MKVNFIDFTKPERFEFIEKMTSWIPGKHKFLDHLPEPWRSKAILFGYRLGLVPAVGYIKIQPCDENGVPNEPPIINANIIPDVGVTRIRDILAGTSSELPTYLEFGIGTTPPAVGDTDLETPLTATARLAATVTTPGSFEIRLEAFLGSVYGPSRPYTINEQAIFTHLSSGVIIAHALVSPGHAMTGTNSASATYGLLIR